MAYRIAMFFWKLRCAWCDVKMAFKYLILGKATIEQNSLGYLSDSPHG